MSAIMELSRLSEIDWSALGHSYGTAEDVPEMLRGLLSPDAKVRGGSYSALIGSLDHQGVQRWTATACAVPFLLGLIADPQTPERDAILDLLGEFAVGDVTQAYLASGFHIDEICTLQGTKERGRFVFGDDERGGPEDVAYGELLRSIYVAVVAGVPIYLELTRSEDVLVRREAAHLLAFMTSEAEPIAPALTRRLAQEDDPWTRGGCGLALSYATLFHPSLHERARPILEECLARANDPRERSLLALALLLHPEPSERARAALLDAMREPPPTSRDCPWASSTSGPMTLRLLLERAPASWHREVIAAACVHLCDHATDPHRALAMAQTLLAARFAPLPPGRVPTSYDAERVVAPADLDDEQALVLETFVRSPIVWAFGNMRLALNGLGLPADAASLEIFLAARPT